MSGTSLVILAMYTTVNVNSPFAKPLSAEGIENILTLMIVAAILAFLAIYLEGNRLPDRRQAGHPTPAVKRKFGSPRQRRH